MEDRFSPFLVLCALVCVIIVASIQYSGNAEIHSHRSFLAPPPEMIERFTFGFDESVADGLWLRWIQDGDTCQTFEGVEQKKLEIDPTLEREFNNPRHKVCDVSWSYKMLDAVTRVAPRFKMPYMAGTMTLAILVEDYDGSTKLFERAIAQYPHDWQILFRAAYHYLFDLKDLPRAADLLDLAAQNGGPPWINLLSARINSRAGRAALGLSTLKRYLETLTEPEARKSVEKRIADLERELRESPRPDGP